MEWPMHAGISVSMETQSWLSGKKKKKNGFFFLFSRVLFGLRGSSCLTALPEEKEPGHKQAAWLLQNRPRAKEVLFHYSNLLII